MDDLKNIIDAVEEKEAQKQVKTLVGRTRVARKCSFRDWVQETAPPSLETPLPAAAPITMALEENVGLGRNS